MRALPITKSAAQLDIRTFRLRVERSFSRAPKRGTRIRACQIELPRKLWDKIVLFMFTCCLFTFLHAFFGFGSVNEDLRALNGTLTHAHAPLSISPRWNRGSVASNETQKTRAQSMTQVVVEWHGNRALLPSIASIPVSPASILQDAFPDPTPFPVRAERVTKTLVNVPTPFYKRPYDPYRLVFEDSVDGGANHGLYPVAGPPRTARTWHFGRCLPEEVCL